MGRKDPSRLSVSSPVCFLFLSFTVTEVTLRSWRRAGEARVRTRETFSVAGLLDVEAGCQSGHCSEHQAVASTYEPVRGPMADGIGLIPLCPAWLYYCGDRAGVSQSPSTHLSAGAQTHTLHGPSIGNAEVVSCLVAGAPGRHVSAQFVHWFQNEPAVC